MARKGQTIIRFATGGLVLLLAGLAIRHFTTGKPEERKPVAKAAAEKPILPPDDETHAQYSGSESCKKCHAAQFENWQHSMHGLAERAFKKEKDNKAFVPEQTLVQGKTTSKAFLDADGVAKILREGTDKKQHAYQAVRVIGEDPLRQFLVPGPGGRLQTMDMTLDPHKNEWFNVHGDDLREPGDWGHWTGQGMNWNAMCAACHNTRLRKNFDPQTNSYKTTMAEMSVGCEACHGPMKEHVHWQEKPPLGADKTKDPTITRFNRDQVTETCAACHARRGELTGDLIPGEPFHDHFSLTLTDESETFYPDGQVHEEDYEYTSFVSSRMHHAGVRCADCHEPHSGKTIVTGNQLCMNCHAGGRADFPTAPVINPTAHSHHGAESTGNQCISCHMPTTVYMQRQPRHDHGFTIPDPKLTKDFNVPNACNRCHTDKDVDWAIQATKTFYGEKPDRHTRSRALLVAGARQGDPVTREGLMKLLTEEPIPAWRATACQLLARWVLDPTVTKAIMGRLKDDNPMVRETAARALGTPARQNNTEVVSALQPLLNDVSRSVRISAAWSLCATLDLDSKAGKELVHMLDLHADQPTGRMQLGQFAMVRGDNPAAIRQMQKAISMDANSPPFHHDLAVLLSTTGDSFGALAEMRKAIELDPDNAEYHYKLALALNETGDTKGSLAEFEKTVRLDLGYARAWYNLGLARNGMGQTAEAIVALKRAEAADPGDATIPYARATIHARLGQKNEAIEAAARALQIRADYPEARQLISSLGRR